MDISETHKRRIMVKLTDLIKETLSCFNEVEEAGFNEAQVEDLATKALIVLTLEGTTPKLLSNLVGCCRQGVKTFAKHQPIPSSATLH